MFVMGLPDPSADHDAGDEEHDLDELRIAAEDRTSARQRQARTRDLMPGYIATVAMVGFFGILVAMIFVAIPDTARDPLMIMLGALGTLVTQVGAYYFGSSAGSARKIEQVERLVSKRAAG